MATRKKTVTKTADKPKTKKASASRDALSAPLVSFDGKSKGTVALPKELFSASASPSLVAQVVYVHQYNQRQGSAHTKNRGDVVGSRRKIWRQKGTGRARHGDRYAPIFVGGGVAHGPHPRVFAKKVTTSMRRKALFSALSQKQKDQHIVVVEGIESGQGKTKKLFSLLRSLPFTMKRGKLGASVLLATASGQKDVYRAGRNIENLSIKEASALNAYDILQHRRLLITKDALPALVSTFVKQ